MTKILVIEDEQAVRANIIERLEAENFNVMVAENGLIGMKLARHYKPDLIICDIMMPEHDGYEVLAILRKDPVTATIPLIFLTAKADKADFRQGMELGADDYLTKPFTGSELLGAIAARLERQATIAQETEKKLESLRRSITNEVESTTSTSFVNHFATLKQAQFNGQLLIKDSSSKQEWNFYLYLGRILYATGGIHPTRRWQRNLATHCPQLNLQQLNLPSGLSSSFWEYELLGLWIKQQQITREQAANMIRAVVAEVIFDITQATQLTYQAKQENPLPLQLLLIDSEQAITAVHQVWQTWQNAKLTDLLPNRAPVIQNPDELQRQTSASIYRHLTALLDGKHTLRDLALKMKREVVEVTSSLLPYIKAGIVKLIDIPDLPSLIVTTSGEAPSQTTSQEPLIACIDDSPLVCQTMEKIITEAGYKFVAVQDPLRAITTLLSRKPDLIFLDLVMPNANGYEICDRLRKISAFRDTPIVFLSGNILDRVRAKVVGSSDYLSKPVKAESVMTVINNYLSKSATLNIT